MLVLAVDSSTRVASVALAKDSMILGEITSDNPKSHSEFVHPAIVELLKKNSATIDEIDLFAVDIGPGSFTGIRVAVNIIRTFAYLQSKMVFTRKSLELLLDQTQEDSLAAINAYKNMLFVALKKSGSLLVHEAVIPAEGLEVFLNNHQVTKPLITLGDGFDFYQSLWSPNLKKTLQRDSRFSDHPSASILALQAHPTNDWKSIIPLYLRASAAEENLKSK